jgi:hypothetical protein
MLIPMTLAVALLAQAQGASPSQPQAAVSTPAVKPASPPANLESYQLVVLPPLGASDLLKKPLGN